MPFTTIIAQGTNSASVSGVIQTIAGAENTEEMSFEKFNSYSIPGELRLNTSIGRKNLFYPGKGGVLNKISPAVFRVSGSEVAYAISLEKNAVILAKKNGTSCIYASEFRLLEIDSIDKSSGVCAFGIGATLSMGAALLAGEYVSLTPYTVTINFN